MGELFEGDLVGAGLRIGIVVARFNETITQQLLTGAQRSLRRMGIADDAVDVAWTPGSYELATAAQALAQTGRYQAIICLGCVIRGATSHHEYVTSAAATGIQQIALQVGLPVIFGVVTAENLEQALQRAGTTAGNRGADAAQAAVEMANLLRRITSVGSAADRSDGR